ncbi:hypothetical protein [Acetobacter thailandicus]|uniref:Uncharacterized protein n=1 Tax=Acetobacter thailandicus TaxID=1502842 RepID=A0ABT3QC87_9PROT|nr:hypothetical protein [Acetobacter thailandicus]MCX2562903.1 hypothetical protein [Acetobacter thailandicus]NHN95693.1 hypothetical protein [Acetobacter thailandicus]
MSPHNVTIPPMVVSSDSVPPDAASRIAARSCTSAAHVWHMVSLRRAGFSLRQIGRRSGRCMEGVRQALMRYEQALNELRDPASEEEGEELMMCGMFRDPEPLPPGHPVAMRGLWRGLEHWRDFV